jgi:hypothetical protein
VVEAVADESVNVRFFLAHANIEVCAHIDVTLAEVDDFAVLGRTESIVVAVQSGARARRQESHKCDAFDSLSLITAGGTVFGIQRGGAVRFAGDRRFTAVLHFIAAR